MPKEDQKARIRERHKKADYFVDRLIKMYDFYESAGEDEPNTIQCVITKDVSREDELEKITRLLKKNCKLKTFKNKRLHLTLFTTYLHRHKFQ